MFQPSRVMRVFLGLLLCASLAACGFALRGTTELPFSTLYINLSPNSQFGAQLRRQIEATSQTRVVDTAQGAEAQLQILDEGRERTELALTAQGRVQEFDLTLRIVFQVLDNQGEFLVPPTTLIATRTLYYDDNVAQSKESEAEMLYRAMRADLLQRIVHRLGAADTRAVAERARSERVTTPRAIR